MTVVEQIAGLELVKVQYRLEFLEPFHFEPDNILHWRKELVRGARRAVELGTEDPLLFDLLLNPRPADDPYAQKQFQKPAPLFIVDSAHLHARDYNAGEVLPLEVLFPGDGVGNALVFARLLSALGELGIFKGAGRFAVASILTMTHQDGWQSAWQQGGALDQSAMVILNAQWLIEKQLISGQSLLLQFVTPARLLKNNRPLFKAGFKELFPFVLRRVTSVLYSSSRLELDLDINLLIKDAADVSSHENRLAWTDWRQLDADHGTQGVGGVTGTLHLSSGLTDDLYSLLRLAELFNLGKGASYGAGRFTIEPVPPEMAEKR